MKQVFKIDSEGNYVEPVILSDGEDVPKDCVEKSPPDGMYKANYDRKKKKWTDLAEPEKKDVSQLPEVFRDGIEINLLLEELVKRVDALEKENKQLKKQK